MNETNLPETISCPECSDEYSISPQYDSIDNVVYLSCDECGFLTTVSVTDFWTMYNVGGQ